MHKIEWNDSLKIGIEEIDNQHKELVDIFNRLCDAIKEGANVKNTLLILQELGQYTTVHFTTEESVMRMLEYPDYPSHKKAHDYLIAELQKLTTAAAQSPQGVNFQLMHMIKQWLSRHIMDTDARYVEHFLKFGIKATLKNKTWFSKFNPFSKN